MFDQPQPAPPIPGATVVPLRDGAAGLEVLLVQRAATMAYGGMWAFPGGRVEHDDAHPDAPGDVLEQARRTAVREAREEVGLAFPDDSLVPYSHWTGGANQGRLFAAWYFLAPAPDAEVVLDGSETLDHRWLAPADAVACRERGEIGLVAPTWMTLHSLTAATTVGEALALARARPPVVYRSRSTSHDGRRVVLWHGDAGYATADAARPGPRHRLIMDEAGWRFERT